MWRSRLESKSEKTSHSPISEKKDIRRSISPSDAKVEDTLESRAKEQRVRRRPSISYIEPTLESFLSLMKQLSSEAVT